jgi:hypothetical protein
MIETNTALGKLYAAFKALVEAGAELPIIAHLNAELAKAGPDNELESIRGHYRMFVSYNLSSHVLYINLTTQAHTNQLLSFLH